jgi:23S rRNA-/tRNA-specific pseudouridylate synthase
MPLSKIEPKIVYKDDYIFVLDKKAKSHSVMHEENIQDSLAYWLMSGYPAQKDIGKTFHDCGLVQRLDFETSGLILAARDQQSWDKLFKDLKAGAIKKYYYCLLKGKLAPEEIEIEGFIGSPYRGAGKMNHYPNQPSKSDRALPAKTEFELIEYLSDMDASLAKATADTARRHQIRVHAKAIKHPLVGDRLYDTSLSLEKSKTSSFYLQASYLELNHPKSGEKMVFKKEPDLAAAIEMIEYKKADSEQ